MSTDHQVDVVRMRWPDEEPQRVRLREEGVPRLLEIHSDVSPPTIEDDLEDWVRVPAPPDDIAARIETLLRRREARRAGPTLDENGVLRFRAAWVSLPPVEARLTALLLERFGVVVSRDALTRAGWPEGAPGRNALDVHVLRLRRRLAQVDLAMRTVRSRGYLLEEASS